MIPFQDFLVQYPGYLLGVFGIFCRLGGFVLGLPFLNHSAIPRRVRGTMVIYLSIAFALALGVPQGPATEGPLQWGMFVLPEFLLGFGLGVIVRVLVAVAAGMGQMVSYSMGLGFATFVDPSTGVDTTVIGRVFQIATLLLFVSIDAHLFLLDALLDTFQVVPLGKITLVEVSRLEVAEWGQKFFELSLRLAAPGLAVGLMIYIVLGVITRVAPQMNLFAFGFAITIPSGLAVLMAETPAYLEIMRQHFRGLPDLMLRLATTGQL